MGACRESYSSFTAKLSRMVGDVKRKRKALAAQHAFVVDLFTAPPSSPVFTPLFPFFFSHIPPSSPSKVPHFTSHTRSTSPLSASPLQPSSYSTPHSTNSSPEHIHDAPRSAPGSPQRIPHIDPHPAKKNFHTHPSNPSPLSASMAPRCCSGKHSAHRTLWAVILLALLCTFFCIGKEIAFGVATVVHLILQISLGLGLLARGRNVNDTVQASCGYNSGEKDNSTGGSNYGRMWPLNRSATVPRSRRPTDGKSIQWKRRSKSWTQINDSVEREARQTEAGGSVGSTATASGQAIMAWVGRGNLSAELKLQVMLLLTLWGLFYGRFVAMCMAVCCIFIWSKMVEM